MNDLKTEILNASNMDQIIDLEMKEYKKFRNEFYNELLKDNKIKEHISKISGVDIENIDNLLMINDAPPLDFFED